MIVQAPAGSRGGLQPKTRLTDMKLPLDAQFAAERKKIKHRKAWTGEVNNPAGFPEEKETSKLILEQWECASISH